MSGTSSLRVGFPGANPEVRICVEVICEDVFPGRLAGKWKVRPCRERVQARGGYQAAGHSARKRDFDSFLQGRSGDSVGTSRGRHNQKAGHCWEISSQAVPVIHTDKGIRPLKFHLPTNRCSSWLLVVKKKPQMVDIVSMHENAEHSKRNQGEHRGCLPEG